MHTRQWGYLVMQSLFRPHVELPQRRSNPRPVAARILCIALAGVFVVRGWDKFDVNGWWATAFQAWGLSPWLRMLIGGIEVTGGVALLAPRLTSYAAMVLSAVVIGTGWTLVQQQRWTDVTIASLCAAGLVWIAYESWHARLHHGRAEPVGPDYSI